ncbi:MAG: hypothetical protein ACTSO9_18275 [Candidatus Helarchaeota archaeon]
MAVITNEKLLKYGFKHIQLKNYPGAIKLFYKILKNSPSISERIRAFIGLGDSLRGEYEIELALKMYNNALVLAEDIEDSKTIKELDAKIENVYVFKKDREINPFQIGFFMRAIMKLLSFLGKTDWF